MKDTYQILWDNNETSFLYYLCESLRIVEDDETKYKLFYIAHNRLKPKSEEYYKVLQAINAIVFNDPFTKDMEPYRELAEHFLEDPDEYWENRSKL